MPLPAPESSASFGPFQLLPAQRVLLAGGRPLRLGSRAFDILAVLVERAGATVTKRELIDRVWPDTVVEEANLRVHVAALRKALGTDQHYIGNVTGQGYAFVAPVRWQHGEPPASAAGAAHDPHTHALAHATARVYLDGPGAGRSAFARAFALAERHHDTGRLADAFSGLALEDVLAGEYGAALALADRFHAAVRPTGSRAALLVHDRVAALALHLSGDQQEAAALAGAVQNQTVPAVCTRRRTALHTDENIAAGVVLARARWLLGHPDDALRTARNGLQRARAVGADTSRCYVLAFALFPVAWWCGDRALALAALAELEDAARALPNWRGLAHQYRTGVVEGGPVTAGAALAAGPHRETLATLDPRYLDDALLRRVERGGARWCAAELRRLHGERLLQTGDGAAEAEAERLFRAALLLARQQGAPGWELRAAMSLARLWHRRGATDGAHELLDIALHRFPDDPAHASRHGVPPAGPARTADVALAAKLLAQWRRTPGREKAGSALACALPA